MLESFFPLIALFLVYTAIAAMSKTTKKVSDNRKSYSASRSAAPAETEPAEGPAPEAAAAPRIREMQPTIRVSEHDDSVYTGSMNAVTGEGYDPCHDEQLKPLTRAETIEPAPAAAPGLRLHWTGDEIVRGFVVSEILKRKGA